MNDNKDEIIKEDEEENESEKIEYLKYSFEQAQRLAEFADQKARTLITIQSVLLTVVVGAIFLQDVQLKITTELDKVIIAIIFTFLVISAYYSINVIKPREPFKKESIFFYMRIAEFKSDEDYYKELKKMKQKEIAKAISNQTYEVSKIAKKKMEGIKKSLNLLVWYFICLLGGSLIIYFY